jgi:hypothetical protein
MIKPYETMPTVVRVIGMLSATVLMGLLGTFAGQIFGASIQILGGVFGSIFGFWISIILLNLLDYTFHLASKGK